MAGATHKECIHFQNGRCTIFHAPVDPNGTDVCANFHPKGKTQLSIQPSRRKLSEIDRKYEKKLLSLQKRMIKEQIKYLERKIKKCRTSQ